MIFPCDNTGDVDDYDDDLSMDGADLSGKMLRGLPLTPREKARWKEAEKQDMVMWVPDDVLRKYGLVRKSDD